MACGFPCDDCLNPTAYEPCGENLTCCEHCPEGAPCAYAILFRCCWENGNGLMMNNITPLWKECLFDCRWTARRCKSQYPAGYEAICGFGSWATTVGCGEGGNCDCGSSGPFTGANGSLYPPGGGATTEVCESPQGILQCFPPVCYDSATEELRSTPLGFGCGLMPSITDVENYRCGWHDWYGRAFPCNLPNYLDQCTAIVWELAVGFDGVAEISGHQADETGYGLDTVVTYRCETFDCLGRNTFVLKDTVYPENYPPGLEKICVVPYSSNFRTPCAARRDACACADAGWDNICLDVSGVTCGLLNDNRPDPLILTRYNSFAEAFPTALTQYEVVLCAVGGVAIDHTMTGSTDPSTCLALPSPAPCGVFCSELIDVSCGLGDYCVTDYGDPAEPTECHCRKIVFFVWCDGLDWKIKVVCVDFQVNFDLVTAPPTDYTITLTCSDLCDTTCTVTETCPDGVVFTFDCGTITSDCCPDCGPVPPVDTDCCADIPGTLYATLIAPTCAIDGTVITLTHQGIAGATNYWAGTFDLGGTCGTVTFVFQILNDGLRCMSGVAIYDGTPAFDPTDGYAGETLLWDNNGIATRTDTICPFTSLTTSGGDLAPGCAAPCVGAIDVTISV